MLPNQQERAEGEEMTPLCNNCGSTLAADVNFCPKCGTPTPSYYSGSSSSQSDPTALSSHTNSSQSEVPTGHGSTPYGTPDKNPYEHFNPYRIAPPPPPPQHRTRFSLIVGFISGVAVSILILGSIGAFVLLTQKVKTTPTVPTAVSSEKCSGASSDEFNGSFNSRWKWINPGDNATYGVTTQGHLCISISAPANNDLYPLTNTNAPRLLQPISGNFTVETLVEFSPSYPYQGAGILIWQDDGNYLRLERGYNGSSGNGILFTKVEKGVLIDVSPFAYHLTTATQVGLRVQMDGDHLTAWWRGPGQDWQNDGETTMHFANATIGLILAANYSQGASQTTAYYDYFRVRCM